MIDCNRFIPISALDEKGNLVAHLRIRYPDETNAEDKEEGGFVVSFPELPVREKRFFWRNKMSGNYKRFLQNKEKELRVNVPCVDGVWNKEYLHEYLVYLNYGGINEYIEEFFCQYLQNEMLCKLLLDFLLDDYYDGSEALIGAVLVLRKMDKSVIVKYKDSVLSAQKNEVEWKRPFKEPLDWLH